MRQEVPQAVTTIDWKQLAASALIGTGRQEVRLVEDAPGEDLESKLLAQAALTATCLRAGWCPPAETPDKISPAPLESVPVVIDGEMHLHQLLTGNRAVLMEWVDEAIACGVVAPASSHVALLEMALTAKQPHRQQMLKVLGNQGRWLAQLNRRWSVLFDERSFEERWQSEEFSERLAALWELRKNDPDTAREVITQAWETEPARERASFLSVFQEALSAADLPLLNRALTDKSVEVKRLAVSLAAQIPGSTVSGQARLIVQSSVRIQKSLLGTKVEILLPSEEPSPFDVLTESVAGAGNRAARLARIVGCVSPLELQSSIGLGLAEIYRVVAKHEFADVLRRGLEISTTRFRDREAADALFPVWLDSKQAVLPEFLHLVSPRLIDEARVNFLQTNSNTAPNYLNLSQPWNEATSIAFLKKYLSADGRYAFEASEVARRLHPATIDGALNSIPPDREHALRSWLEILPLRRDMIRTIRRSANR